MVAVAASELQTLSNWMSTNVLTESCAIQREINSVWTMAATVPCAIVGPDANEKDISDEQTGAVLKYILMPRNTDVRSPDRLVVNSITYRVQDIKEPSTFEVLRRVMVVRFPQRGGA